MLCFTKFPVAEKFMDNRGGGLSRFPSNFFVSQSGKRCRETLQCFINFGGQKNLDERVVGGGECQVFQSKFSCLTVPKIS